MSDIGLNLTVQIEVLAEALRETHLILKTIFFTSEAC